MGFITRFFLEESMICIAAIVASSSLSIASSLTWIPPHISVNPTRSTLRHAHYVPLLSKQVDDDSVCEILSEDICEFLEDEVPQDCINGVSSGDISWWQRIGAELPWGKPFFKYDSRRDSVSNNVDFFEMNFRLLSLWNRIG